MSQAHPIPTRSLPLYVDLDGTLVKTDVFAESVLSMARADPGKLLHIPLWLMGGKARAKAMAHRHGPVAVERLPFCTPLIEYLSEEKRAGRKIHLATAAERGVAEQVADHLGLFDGVIASDGCYNAKGAAKLERIRAAQSDAPFAYAGNSYADRPLWNAAASCVFVDAPKSEIKAAEARGKVEKVIRSSDNKARALIKALRPHQWTKNLLVFVPLLTAHAYTNPNALFNTLVAFAAFCVCASALYIVNDLLDIQNDRTHPAKHKRPFAAGTLSIATGVVAAPALLLIGFGASLALMPSPFIATLAIYCVVSLLYSIWLKRVSTVDVFALAGLYTVRVIAGSAAIGVAPSFWLLALSMFIFLSLAYVKRYVELDRLREAGGERLSGRGYATVDLETTFTLGAISGGLGVLVMALYINSPEVRLHYPTPEFLWAVCPILLYWINRIWLGTRRGKIHDDPVVFALKDRISIVAGVLCLLAVAAAHFIVL